MIVLNTAKELVRLESWSDIEGRAGYSDELDPAQHKLSSIIGQYAFQAQIRCGLTNCHTAHNRGYLVVTQSGARDQHRQGLRETLFRGGVREPGGPVRPRHA